MKAFRVDSALFEKILRQYAFEIGHPIHTYEDQQVAFTNYCNIAKILN